MKHFSNKLMIAAFTVGIFLQVLVTASPYFSTAFGTCILHKNDWQFLLTLSAMPLLAHELLLVFRHFSKKEG